MEFIEAKEEYVAALRRAQREYKDRTFAGKNPHPAVLDELLDDNAANVVQDIGGNPRTANRRHPFSRPYLHLFRQLSASGKALQRICHQVDDSLSGAHG